MENMRKISVFEVLDEKECFDNGCKPLKLKWCGQDEGREMQFEIGLSGDQKGKGQRRKIWARRRILTRAAVGRVQDACVHNDDRTR